MLFRLFACIFSVLTCLSPIMSYASGSYGDTPPNRSALSDATTNRLVRTLERGIRLCQSVETVYRYDCYRQNYNTAAQQIEKNPAYAVPLQALRNIEQTLGTIVARNADPAAKPVRKRGKTFRAVTPASTKKAKETFRRSLDSAATVLLRSSGDSAKHYVRIAQALDSNKILLRAAEMLICPTLSQTNCHAQTTPRLWRS